MKLKPALILFCLAGFMALFVSGCSSKSRLYPVQSKPLDTDIAALAQKVASKTDQIRSLRYELNITGEPKGTAFSPLSFNATASAERLRRDIAGPDKLYMLVDSQGNYWWVNQARKVILALPPDAPRHPEDIGKPGDQPAANAPDASPIHIAQIDPKATVGQTTLDGKDAYLIEFRDVHRVPSRLWLGREWGLPLRLERQMKGGYMLCLWTYSDLDAVPESDLALPKGFKVHQLDFSDPMTLTPEERELLATVLADCTGIPGSFAPKPPAP